MKGEDNDRVILGLINPQCPPQRRTGQIERLTDLFQNPRLQVRNLFAWAYGLKCHLAPGQRRLIDSEDLLNERLSLQNQRRSKDLVTLLNFVQRP